MRHRKSGRKLNMNSSHRAALFRSLTTALIHNEVIKTTLPRAKEMRRYIEPLITISRTDSVASRRIVFARTRDRQAVTKLFEVLGPRYTSRPGGYLRIMKCGLRSGDSAPMAYVELVDRPTV